MTLAPDPRRGAMRRCAELQVEGVVGEIAVAMTYLYFLREGLHPDEASGQSDADAIPPSALIAIRRSCQSVSRHSGRALAAMNPRRAAQADAVASQLREVEQLRYRGRRR